MSGNDLVMEDSDYAEIELTLEQAQKELGDAIISFSATVRADEEDAMEGQNKEVKRLSNHFRSPERSDTVDFLSIFAEHGLTLDTTLPSSSNQHARHHQLPVQSPLSMTLESHQGPTRPERPLTLSRPVKVPSCCNFKRQPWRLYVQGDFSYKSLPRNLSETDYVLDETYKEDLESIMDELNSTGNLDHRWRKKKTGQEAVGRKYTEGAGNNIHSEINSTGIENNTIYNNRQKHCDCNNQHVSNSRPKKGETENNIEEVLSDLYISETDITLNNNVPRCRSDIRSNSNGLVMANVDRSQTAKINSELVRDEEKNCVQSNQSNNSKDFKRTIDSLNDTTSEIKSSLFQKRTKEFVNKKSNKLNSSDVVERNDALDKTCSNLRSRSAVEHKDVNQNLRKSYPNGNSRTNSLNDDGNFTDIPNPRSARRHSELKGRTLPKIPQNCKALDSETMNNEISVQSNKTCELNNENKMLAKTKSLQTSINSRGTRHLGLPVFHVPPPPPLEDLSDEELVDKEANSHFDRNQGPSSKVLSRSLSAAGKETVELKTFAKRRSRTVSPVPVESADSRISVATQTELSEKNERNSKNLVHQEKLTEDQETFCNRICGTESVTKLVSEASQSSNDTSICDTMHTESSSYYADAASNFKTFRPVCANNITPATPTGKQSAHSQGRKTSLGLPVITEQETSTCGSSCLTSVTDATDKQLRCSTAPIAKAAELSGKEKCSKLPKVDSLNQGNQSTKKCVQDASTTAKSENSRRKFSATPIDSVFVKEKFSLPNNNPPNSVNVQNGVCDNVTAWEEGNIIGNQQDLLFNSNSEINDNNMSENNGVENNLSDILRHDNSSPKTFSLLDSMHKKFYPDQYACDREQKTRSAEVAIDAKTRWTNASKKNTVRSATLPHSKTLPADENEQDGNAAQNGYSESKILPNSTQKMLGKGTDNKTNLIGTSLHSAAQHVETNENGSKSSKQSSTIQVKRSISLSKPALLNDDKQKRSLSKSPTKGPFGGFFSKTSPFSSKKQVKDAKPQVGKNDASSSRKYLSKSPSGRLQTSPECSQEAETSASTVVTSASLRGTRLFSSFSSSNKTSRLDRKSNSLKISHPIPLPSDRLESGKDGTVLNNSKHDILRQVADDSRKKPVIIGNSLPNDLERKSINEKIGSANKSTFCRQEAVELKVELATNNNFVENENYDTASQLPTAVKFSPPTERTAPRAVAEESIISPSSGCSEISPSLSFSTSCTLSPESGAGHTSTSGVSSDRSASLSTPSPTPKSNSPCHLPRTSISYCDTDKIDSNASKQVKEIKLLEECRWLMAAGFPQYVQLYKDDRFPISLTTVEADHDFLDRDCLKALTRRLSALNKLADACIQLPKTKQPLLTPGLAGFHTAEVYALSNRWRFDQLSQQWLWTTSASCNHQPLNVQTNLPNFQPNSTFPSSFEQLHPDELHVQTNLSSIQPNSTFASSLDQLHSEGYSSGVLVSDRLSCEGLVSEDFSPGGVGTDRGGEEVTSARLTSGYASESSPQSSASRHSRTDSGGLTGQPPTGDEGRASDSSTSPMAPRRANLGGSVSSAGSDTLFDEVPASPGIETSKNRKSLLSTTSNKSGLNSRNGSVSTKSDQSGSISWTDLLKRRAEQHNKKPGDRDERILNEEGEDTYPVLKRHSFYDNLSPTELNSMTPDVQRELDLILSELYYNIGHLNENKSNIPVQSSARNGSTSEMCSRKKSSTLPVGRTQSLSDHFTSSSLPSSHAGYSRHVSIDASKPLDHQRDIRDNIPGERDRPNSDELTQSRHANFGIRREVCERDNQPVWKLRAQNGNTIVYEDDYPGSSTTDWNKCHSTDGCSEQFQINRLYAKQLTALRKLSLLKLTALFDKHCQKFNLDQIVSPQRSRSSQFRHTSEPSGGKKIFGVSLQSLLERDLCSIPRAIHLAVEHLRRVGLDAVGLFRRSGIQSRIQKLQNDMDQDAALDFSSVDVYDVADALKRYFRELPECLLTESTSSLFLAIFISVPEELRTAAVRRAIILLPDANRLALQFLIDFLYNVTEQSGENQMTASNLAVCFLPSFFRPPDLAGAGGAGGTPEPVKKSDHKSENKSEATWDYKAALACVTCLISHAKLIFTVPEDSWPVVRMSSYSCNQEMREIMGHVQSGLTRSHITSYIQFCLDMSLAEQSDWLLLNTRDREVTLCVKDVHDNECLRTWRCVSEVPAEPSRVLERLVKERHMWCSGLVSWHVVERAGDNCDVFYSVIDIPGNGVAQPTEFCEFRCWRSDLPRGACALVSASTDAHPLVHNECTSRGSVLASHAYIELCRPGVSRLVLVSRVDLRGHSVDWYTAVYGKLLVEDIIRLKESFQ